jgi:hypothetical protein
MTAYTQLWARDAALSIPTLCVDKCKFLIHAETFSVQKGSNFSRVFPGPDADSSGTHTVGTETAAATLPSKLGSYCKACSLASLCHARFWRRAGYGVLNLDIVSTTAPSHWARMG